MPLQSLGKAKVEIESIWMKPSESISMEEAVNKLKELKYIILDIDYHNRMIKVKP